MKVLSILSLSAALLMSGCASVDLAPQADSDKAKVFTAPSSGNAGVYIYRNSFVGRALKKDIWINGNCVGESAPDVFFYTEVAGGKTHKVETESEFSPNALDLMVESGKHYFVEQFIKLGLVVGGADLVQVPEDAGKKAVSQLSMAKSGNCSAAR